MNRNTLSEPQPPDIQTVCFGLVHLMEEEGVLAGLRVFRDALVRLSISTHQEKTILPLIDVACEVEAMRMRATATGGQS